MYLVPVYICEIGIVDVNWSQHIHLPYRLLKFEEKNIKICLRNRNK